MTDVIDFHTRCPVAVPRAGSTYRVGDRVRLQRSGNLGVVRAFERDRVVVHLMGGLVRSVRPADLAPAPTPPDGGAA